MSAGNITSSLYKSARIEITIAFVVPVVMLGIACAMSTGLPIDWNNLMLGGCVIFFLLMISNGLNNLVDEKIDRASAKTGSKKSRMHHILNITGGASRGELLSIVVLSGFAVILLLCVLGDRTGYPVLVFAALGMFMAIEYNLPPLKLAYRPFPELTMLLPSTVVAVVAMQYILVDQITATAVCMGTAFGLFSATWFLWQSMIDYEVDKAAGKKTTPVYVGPLNAGIVGIVYPGVGVAVLALVSGRFGLSLYEPAILGIICMAGMGVTLALCVQNSHKVWRATMWQVFLYGVFSAAAIMMWGC